MRSAFFIAATALLFCIGAVLFMGCEKKEPAATTIIVTNIVNGQPVVSSNTAPVEKKLDLEGDWDERHALPGHSEDKSEYDIDHDGNKVTMKEKGSSFTLKGTLTGNRLVARGDPQDWIVYDLTVADDGDKMSGTWSDSTWNDIPTHWERD